MNKLIGRISIILGLLLIAAALGLVLYNRWDSERAGKESAKVLDVLTEAIIENTEEADSTIIPGGSKIPGGSRIPGTTRRDPIDDSEIQGSKPMATEEIDGYEYIGVVEIPALDILLPVMADWDYRRLTVSPCRFTGSYYSGDLVICAHNNAAHFGQLLYIDIGTDIFFTTVKGKTYHYQVSNREIVKPTALEEMITGDDWDMTLFTCTIGGQTRCAVRCELMDD
ncbi:MAG: sortase [Firmicutes bacterium]|nr:sortase [Bacillota bacterium]